MKIALATLPLFLFASPLRAQTYLTVEQSPPGVRRVDVTAGVLISEPLIDLLAVQPPLSNATVESAIKVNSEIWVSAGPYVYRFDAAGNQIGASGPFSLRAQGMDFVAGSVWLATGSELAKIAIDGTVTASFPQPGAAHVFGWNGRLLVSDASDDRIEVYDTNGQFVSVFAAAPSPQGNPFIPGQIALQPSNGNLLVTGILRIYELDPTGAFVGEYQAGTFEQGVAPLDDGRLLVNLYEGVVIFDPQSGESIPVPGFEGQDLRDLALFGPGSGAAQRYCPANANSTGQSAQVGAFGSLSVGSDDFALHASLAPPGQFGLFFYGPNVAQIPWGDGLLCTGPSGINRILPAVAVAPTGTVAREVSFPGLPPAGAILPGSTWSFQFVYRDPSGGPAGFNATDAVRLTFEP